MATCLHRIAVTGAALLAACLSTVAGAQSVAGGVGMLDVRAFMPGLRYVDHGAPIERTRTQLTSEERMEIVRQDRIRGALRAAGEGADPHPLRSPSDTLRVAPAATAPTPVASREADKPS